MRPNSPPRTMVDLQRRDGIRKKNGRIDIPQERNIHTICIPASHAQWDLGSRGLASVVRASVHVYNDNGDIDALVGAVAEIAAARVVS